MSSSVVDAPRRRLSDRQADTVARLVDATVVELGHVDFDGLTVRNVARRAGVAPATAYTYFSSKDHLVAEVFWRRLEAMPPAVVRADLPVRRRVARVLAEVATLLADEPALASACTSAMLGSDPDIRALRDRIGASIHQRFAVALDGVADDSALRVLDLVLSGAMVQAGMGHLPYDELAARLAEVSDRLFDTEPDEREERR